MGSQENTKTWVPYINTQDCTQEICTIYCPQWCYTIFPPPSPSFEFQDDNTGPNLSPIIIAIIGVLASAFLLITYYVVISKYCMKNMDSRRTSANHTNPDLEPGQNHDLALSDQPWHVSTNGLDENLIKTISIFKYKKKHKVGDVEKTEQCSVCLSEFSEEESLRLLPNCDHIFHLPCIDTWLKSHSNCPLCRADIVRIHAKSSITREEESSSDQNEHHLALQNEEEVHNNADVLTKNSLRAYSDLGFFDRRDSVIEIKYEGDHSIRRSLSMNYL